MFLLLLLHIANLADFNILNKLSILLFKHIMRPNSKEQLISEQIDITIIGSKTFELLEILMDQDLKLVPLPKLSNNRLATLQSLYPAESNLAFQHPTVFPSQFPNSHIQKYTTNILTNSFWLQFNFFYFGVLSHDPLLATISKGKISICIVVSNQNEFEYNQFKRLLSRDNQHMSNRQKDIEAIQKSTQPRQQLIMQQKIINLIHDFKLNEYSSILMLKMLNKNRIMQASSNIKLNRNQIMRWIVDRHFQNQFGIKLHAQVSDEIENYKDLERKNYCKIM